MSSVLQSLSSLIQGRQNNRILRLSFPHNDGPKAQLLVNKLDAVESLSRDFDYTVELLSDDAELPLKDLQGKLFCVELVRGDGSLRYFTGYCFEFRLVRTDGNITFYQAKLGPWTQYLRLRKDNYIFHGKTLREQIDSICADYGTLPDWDYRVSGTDPVMTDAIQFDESDHNYVHRRLEAAGLLYHYEHTDKGHKLVITDDSTQAAAIDGGEEIRFQRHGGAFEEDGIGEFSPVRQIVPSSVSLSGFNFKSPVPINAGVPTLNKQGNVLDVESYEYAGAYGVKGSQDADKLSRQHMEEIEAAGKHFEAAGNNRYVLPGRWYRLTGHFSSSPFASHEEAGKNEFLIISVHHIASNNYLQQADQKAEYRNELTCLRKTIPWRPGRNFNSVSTKILFPQTVTVVGPSGQGSIHTDEYGRIRVQFHWDRIGNNDERSSAWVRVASSWAGGELGAKSIPRVGSECLVQWLDGNPDRPIVTGSVYNQRNMPPWKLATQQSLMGFRSRELTPNGGNKAGGRSNHLILDDTNGKIQAQLKSDHQHSQLSLGSITRIEDNAGRKDARGEGWELRSDGHGVARAAKGMLITTEARNNAVSHIKDMGETVERLTSAREQQETLASLAQNYQAQQTSADQSDVAHAIKLQNDTIKGSGQQGELESPHLILASPDGIQLTSAKSTHIASDQHTALTTGQHLSIATGKSFFGSITEKMSLFVQKAGMKLFAAKGKVEIQAQSDNIEIIADQVLKLISAKSSINISANKEIVLNVGGSYIKINAGGIEHGTNGTWVAHAATHSLPGPANLPDAKRMWPGDVQTNLSTKVVVDRQLQDWMATAGVASIPYQFIDQQGSVVAKGMLDDMGMTKRIFHKDTEELTALFGEKGPWNVIEHHDEGCGCGDHVHNESSPAAEHSDDETDHLADFQAQQAKPDMGAPGARPQTAGGINIPVLPVESIDDFAKHMLSQFVFNDPDVQKIIADGED